MKARNAMPMPLTLGDLHKIRELTGGHHIHADLPSDANCFNFRTYVTKNRVASFALHMEESGFSRKYVTPSLKVASWVKTETYDDDRFLDICFHVTEIP